MWIVAIASQKGGAGKSTLAAHFSVIADDASASVLLLDADPQGSLASWHARRESPRPILAKVTAGDLAGILADAKASGIATVIVDTPPRNEPIVGAIMRAATLTVVPVRPGAFDLEATAVTFETARWLKVRAVALLNHTPPPRFMEPGIVREARQVLASMGAQVLGPVVSQRAALAHAVVGGQTVGEFEPGGPAAREIAAAWAAIVAEMRGKGSR